MPPYPLTDFEIQTLAKCRNYQNEFGSNGVYSKHKLPKN